jgi:hypothetical protein
MSAISTPITELFGIKHPILLAGVWMPFLWLSPTRVSYSLLPGMNVAAGPELAAAVTNAGGLGVIGGVGYTPNVLRQQVRSPLFPLTSVPIHGRKPNT